MSRRTETKLFYLNNSHHMRFSVVCSFITKLNPYDFFRQRKKMNVLSSFYMQCKFRCLMNFMNLLLLSFYLWNPYVYITDNDWIWEWSLQWWNHLSRCENKALKKRRRKKTSQRPVRELNPWPLTGISAATSIEGILTLKSEHMLLGIKTSQE